MVITLCVMYIDQPQHNIEMMTKLEIISGTIYFLHYLGRTSSGVMLPAVSVHPRYQSVPVCDFHLWWPVQRWKGHFSSSDWRGPVCSTAVPPEWPCHYMWHFLQISAQARGTHAEQSQPMKLRSKAVLWEDKERWKEGESPFIRLKRKSSSLSSSLSNKLWEEQGHKTAAPAGDSLPLKRWTWTFQTFTQNKQEMFVVMVRGYLQ